MNTFEIGARVVLPENSNLDEWNVDEEDVTRGAVKSIGEDGKFLVHWDNSWNKPSKHFAEDLMPEEEANKILSVLEAEYEIWAAPIREKMEQVATLIGEAGELASKQNKALAEMHELVGPLIGSMRKTGWHTSSLNC